MSDPTKYRVTLLCKCQLDAAEGYGSTLEEARANAVKFFQKDHGKRAKWREEIAEHAVPNYPGGTASHYEEIPS
jgi:hypothetical protein